GSLAFPIEFDLSKTSCLRLVALADSADQSSTSPEAGGNNGLGVSRHDVEAESDDDDEADPGLADEATSLLTANEHAEENGLLRSAAKSGQLPTADQQVAAATIAAAAAASERLPAFSLIDIFGEMELEMKTDEMKEADVEKVEGEREHKKREDEDS